MFVAFSFWLVLALGEMVKWVLTVAWDEELLLLIGPTYGLSIYCLVHHIVFSCEIRLMGEDAGLTSSVVKGAGTVVCLFAWGWNYCWEYEIPHLCFQIADFKYYVFEHFCAFHRILQETLKPFLCCSCVNAANGGHTWWFLNTENCTKIWQYDTNPSLWPVFMLGKPGSSTPNHMMQL